MMPLVRVLQVMPRLMSSVRVVPVVPVVWVPLVMVCGGWRLVRCFGGEGVVVDVSGRVPLCPRVEAWWFVGSPVVVLWLPLVPEAAGGDVDGGVVLAMVLLMPLAWVV